MTEERYYTLSEVAKRLGETDGRKIYDRVRYMRTVEPLKVGADHYKIRLYTESDVAKIERAIKGAK